MDPVEVTKTSSTLFTAFIFVHSEVAVSSTPLGRPAALKAAAPEEAAAFKETLSLISGSFFSSGFPAIILFCPKRLFAIPAAPKSFTSKLSAPYNASAAMQLPSNDNMASRADAPHTQTAAEKFGEEKFSERKEKIGKKGRLKGHFDMSTAS